MRRDDNQLARMLGDDPHPREETPTSTLMVTFRELCRKGEAERAALDARVARVETLERRQLQHARLLHDLKRWSLGYAVGLLIATLGVTALLSHILVLIGESLPR